MSSAMRRRTRSMTPAQSVAMCEPSSETTEERAREARRETRSAAASALTVDDDGALIVDVQPEAQLDDSQKENIPLTLANDTAVESAAGLFDKYRPAPSQPQTAPADSAATKRKSATLPITAKKRAKATKPIKGLRAVTSDADTSPSDASIPRPTRSPFSPTQRHRSLAPLLPDPTLGHPPPVVLIIGSAPGEASLIAQRYYAYKYNHFWPIVTRLFHFDIDAPYEQRVLALTSKGVAVWDVCREFTRKGSLDSNLRGVTPNDFAALFDAHPSIRLVASNGGTSYALFRRHVGAAEVARRRLVHVLLPSSSPAHAMKNAVDEKTRRWKEALQIGDDGELLLAKQSASAERAVKQAEQGDLVEIED